METTDVVDVLGALAQETRIDVFRLLVEAAPDGLPAGEIARTLDVPAPTLSFHLKTLAQAGLVQVRRDGRSLLYSPDFPRLEATVAFLTENCCQRPRRRRS